MLKIDLTGAPKAGKNAGITAEVRKWDGTGWNGLIPQPEARFAENAYAVVPPNLAGTGSMSTPTKRS